VHNQESSVGMATGYGVKGRGSFSGRGNRFFSTESEPALGSTHHIILANGYQKEQPPGIKRPRLEADHPPLYSAKVKNGGAISALPHTSPRRDAWLIKHRNIFILPYQGLAIPCRDYSQPKLQAHGAEPHVAKAVLP
jgi:hypothetical protein